MAVWDVPGCIKHLHLALQVGLTPLPGATCFSGSVIAAGARYLNRRARYAAVGAEHTAVTWQGFEQGAAVFALIVILTSIHGHGLTRHAPAFGAGEYGD